MSPCAGVQCAAYHAGLKPALREKVLADWSAGRLPCVAATIAFGMGIDRAAVRLVVHYNLPKTLESSYQVMVAHKEHSNNAFGMGINRAAVPLGDSRLSKMQQCVTQFRQL